MRQNEREREKENHKKWTFSEMKFEIAFIIYAQRKNVIQTISNKQQEAHKVTRSTSVKSNDTTAIYWISC